jgi:hypothetical protein
MMLCPGHINTITKPPIDTLNLYAFPAMPGVYLPSGTLLNYGEELLAGSTRMAPVMRSRLQCSAVGKGFAGKTGRHEPLATLRTMVSLWEQGFNVCQQILASFALIFQHAGSSVWSDLCGLP